MNERQVKMAASAARALGKSVLARAVIQYEILPWETYTNLRPDCATPGCDGESVSEEEPDLCVACLYEPDGSEAA